VTGRLTAPGDREELASALASLIGDPEARARLGVAGERRVRTGFDMEQGIDALAHRFKLLCGGTASKQYVLSRSSGKTAPVAAPAALRRG
jgi:hypothetical protein